MDIFSMIGFAAGGVLALEQYNQSRAQSVEDANVALALSRFDPLQQGLPSAALAKRASSVGNQIHDLNGDYIHKNQGALADQWNVLVEAENAATNTEKIDVATAAKENSKPAESDIVQDSPGSSWTRETQVLGSGTLW